MAKKKKKSTKTEKFNKALDVYKMLCQRFSYTEICRDMAKYNLSTRQIDRYIQYATRRICKETGLTVDEWRNRANKTFDLSINELIKKKKWKDVAYVQAQQNKINGLESQVIKHEGKVETVDMSAVIAELKKNLDDCK